jgi:hypothetical protein
MEVAVSKVPRKESHVKITLHVQAHTEQGYTIKRQRGKTIIIINDGEIVLVLRPP